MAMRIAARYVPRRLSSSGKILSEEEKAAENVYIKDDVLGLAYTDAIVYALLGFPFKFYLMGIIIGFVLRKIEQEKLEKLARKGAKPEGKPPTSSEGTASDVKLSAPAASTTSRVSTDEFRNYAVVAGVVTGLSALGWWYFGSKDKKTEEVHD
ncbi:hypothetical protein RHSIM_Rhsim13G0112500 [Rhododendron simsii]|uniref:Uncharacterized protein n=1 Tax=Rhododendron simsii TaxID=118357 RepID=A0A834FXJ8_RHOSS|nr:hypothetical protein RHSIM_Rhsim13G0112500 [Rhododendron simsii]